jgi:hypothetical protein
MFKIVFPLLVLMLLVAGCASVKEIGEIGTHKIYNVKTENVFAPSTSTILTHNTEDGTLMMVNGGSGASGLGQIAGPAAVVGGAYFIGKGLGDSGDNVTVKEGDTTNLNVNSSTSGATAGSTSGAAATGGGFTPPGLR